MSDTDLYGGLAGNDLAVREEYKRRLMRVCAEFPGRLFDSGVDLLANTVASYRLQDAADVLKEHQKWRRGLAPYDGDTPETHRDMPFDPESVGRALDTAIAATEAVARWRRAEAAAKPRLASYGAAWRKDAMGMEKEQLVNMIASIGTRYQMEFEDSCREMGRMMALMRRLMHALETAVGIYRNQTAAPSPEEEAARRRLIADHSRLAKLARTALGEEDGWEELERLARTDAERDADGVAE